MDTTTDTTASASLGYSNEYAIPRDEWALAKAMQKKGYENQKFIQSDPKVKRITVARDVLKWLKTGKMRARTQSYLLLAPDVVDVVNGTTCTACALGGLFACAVERGDAGGTVVAGGVEGSKPYTFSSYRIRAKLSMFSEEQLGLIEAAFEGRNSTPTSAKVAAGWDSDQLNACYAFYDRYRGATTRMRAIMRNIIRNDGTFVPTDV